MLISIALATYNGEKYLKEQLDSILAQTISDYEVIVCDDCSSDSTMSFLNEYAKKDSRFKIFQNEKNLGFKKNFEKILSLCSGEFIAFCDQDDVWTKDHLEILLNNIGANDCICGNASMIDGEGNPLNMTMRDFIPVRIIPQNNEVFFEHELYGNIVQGAASMIRRKLVCEALPIPGNVVYHDWWIALVASINSGCSYIDQVVLKYRRHEENVTKCPRFGLKTALRLFMSCDPKWNKSYAESVGLLNAISKKCLKVEQKDEIKKAQKFFYGLLNKQNRLWCIFHYLTNYNTIQLSYKRNLLSFLYRVLCISLKGVKL